LHSAHFQLDSHPHAHLLRLTGGDETNILSRARVTALTEAILALYSTARPLIITGNSRFFSAGADLNDVAALTGATAYDFAALGQSLMNAIAGFPAMTIAAINGYCLGGALDIALACTYRIAAPNAVVGHRGASLGIITGWGGTQRLPEIIGKARALQMFLCAEKLNAEQAHAIGLIDLIADDPVAAALERAAARP
jgi:enoyl-CoA hydratase